MNKLHPTGDPIPAGSSPFYNTDLFNIPAPYTNQQILDSSSGRPTFRYDFNFTTYLSAKLGKPLSVITLDASINIDLMNSYLTDNFNKIEYIVKIRDHMYNNTKNYVPNYEVGEFLTTLDHADIILLNDEIGIEVAYSNLWDAHKKETILGRVATIRFFFPIELENEVNNHVDKILQLCYKRNVQVTDEDGEPIISVIAQDNIRGFYIDKLNLKKSIGKINDELFDLHYGEGFMNFNDKVISTLKNGSKGIVLLHGKPGTGKSYYIKYLLSKIYNLGKDVIYIPSNYIDSLLDPAFSTFLIGHIRKSDNPSIILLEDAETLVETRDSNLRSQGVSNLLNLTDGIINDILGVQVIITFNTELDYIDKALLRPERLLARKEFRTLPIENSQKLLDHLDIQINATEDMTLAEIYSIKHGREIITHDYNKTEKVKVGFI